MDLERLADHSPPLPWAEAANLPWDAPDFSRRMLREHLDQGHDMASRRLEVIDGQVAWIHETLANAAPGGVLDLGCGPGLYTSRLARLGHQCVGIDIAPASVEHARAEAERDGLACEYRLGDIGEGGFGGPYGLVMLVFGECNAFPPGRAAAILGEAAAALAPGGRLLLEPHTYDGVRSQAAVGATWWAARRGLFGDEAHLVLQEVTWDPEAEATVRRWTVIEGSGEIRTYGSTLQAYSRGRYRGLLERAGFGDLAFHPGMGIHRTEGLQVIVASR